MRRFSVASLVAAAALCACAPDAVERVEEEPDAADGTDAATGSGGAGGAGGVDASIEVAIPDAPRETSVPDQPEREVATGNEVLPDAVPTDGSRDAAPDMMMMPVVPPPAWMGGQMILAVGNDGRRMHSLDGIAWMNDTRDIMGNSSDSPKVLRAVTYGNKVAVAVGGGCMPDCVPRLLTFDGKTWTEVSLPAAVARLLAVAYGNGVWVAVGNGGVLVRSVDHGKTWTVNPNRIGTGVLRGLAFGNIGGTDMFVVTGEGYVRARSLDGLTWTDLQPSNNSTDAFRSVAMGNGIGVVVGGRTNLGRRMRTVDGITWTDDVAGGSDLTNLLFADGKFLAYAGSAEVHLSADGKTWMTQATTNGGSNPNTGLLNNTRLYISRSSPSTIKTSNDGITWTTRMMSIAGDATINAFAFAGY